MRSAVSDLKLVADLLSFGENPGDVMPIGLCRLGTQGRNRSKGCVATRGSGGLGSANLRRRSVEEGGKSGKMITRHDRKALVWVRLSFRGQGENSRSGGDGHFVVAASSRA